ncbi:hypothetical protein CVT25_007837 [Psilocybe cyanescens]|uniref:Uncharacterized protein n=1 Tax=Psilocybe cyanescens TaxID=93625 RepID=A0A409XR65_PSICY|nr:hypothetical protein CVT25_007837 [Psilocybe cyanescens]
MGNTYEFGDNPVAKLPALPQKGQVMIFISSENSASVVLTQTPPKFQRIMPIHHMSKPLFEALAKKLPTIKNSEYIMFVHNIVWDLLGLFEEITSADGDKEITWQRNLSLPTALSSVIKLSAAGMLSTNTGLVVANASQSVAPVALVQSCGPVKVALTTEQIQMTNALNVSPEMYCTGNAGTLQENYAHYFCFFETDTRFAQI